MIKFTLTMTKYLFSPSDSLYLHWSAPRNKKLEPMKKGVLSNFARSHISSDRVRSGYEIAHDKIINFFTSLVSILGRCGRELSCNIDRMLLINAWLKTAVPKTAILMKRRLVNSNGIVKRPTTRSESTTLREKWYFGRFLRRSLRYFIKDDAYCEVTHLSECEYYGKHGCFESVRSPKGPLVQKVSTSGRGQTANSSTPPGSAPKPKLNWCSHGSCCLKRTLP